MKKSRGFWTKNTRKMVKSPRERGMLPVTRIIKEFKPGDRVHIKIEPSFHKGMPHPRFHGKTGIVQEKRGRAYVVKVKDGNAEKTIIAHPVHLHLQRS